MILAGDIGGTYSRLGVFEVQRDKLHLMVREKYPSQQHRSLEEIVRTFVARHRVGMKHACFGIAGPVRSGCANPPN